MAYADCFAAALAKLKNAELLTGDPEFKQVEKEIKIVRAKVDLKDKVANANLIEANRDGQRLRLGWINLPSFYADMESHQSSCTKDVRRLLDRLKSENISGLVLDLRGNGGGSLEEAVVEAGAVRFRPMLLTAAAVVVGSLVILFDPIFQGLALSLMMGEVAATLLSRMAVPVVYYLLARRGRAASLRQEGLAPAVAA